MSAGRLIRELFLFLGSKHREIMHYYVQQKSSKKPVNNFRCRTKPA